MQGNSVCRDKRNKEQAASQPANHLDNHQGGLQGSHPGLPTSQVGKQAASQPASQSASQPTSYLGNHQWGLQGSQPPRQLTKQPMSK